MFKHKSSFILLIFCIGFTALVYEIFSVKVLFLFYVENIKAATLSISSFLAGLAFSSLIFSKLAKSIEKSVRALTIMQLIVAFYGYFILANYEFIPHVLDLTDLIKNEAVKDLIKMLIIWIYLFIPAFFIGGAFPIVLALYISNTAQDHKSTTFNTGLIYFWDTIGGIFGAITTGFFLIPFLGLRLTVVIPVVINLIIFITLAHKKYIKIIFSVLTILIIYNETSSLPQSIQSKNQTSKSNLTNTLDKRFGNKILFQKTSPYGIVTVGLDSNFIPGNKGLFINYRDMCHSKLNSSEKTIGELTSNLTGKNSKILNIGLGCGFTASQINSHNNTKSLDICEINPIVVEANKAHFNLENNHVLESKKVNLHLIDGAEFIRKTSNTYNAIVIDIEEVSVIYSSPLYTLEYFNIMKSKLVKNGYLAIWSFLVNPKFDKILFNTLKTKFKNVQMRVINENIIFMASDKDFSLKINDAIEANKIEAIKNEDINELNTLDNKALEKYYDSNKIFSLPVNYKEKFVR